MILVGHVTKDGQIAGPRVVEHMVDAVVSFEGEGGHQFRILRAVKNRFGPTDEIGVFEMTGAGLSEVTEPVRPVPRRPRRLRAGRRRVRRHGGHAPGARRNPGAASPPPRSARRAAPSWAGIPRRLSMVLAVLEAHGGLRLGQHDVYLNVAGGLRIDEPAADLAAAAALVSSLTGAALPSDSVYFGEIALSGAVRPVAQAGHRLKEAAKLGFQLGHRAAAALSTGRKTLRCECPAVGHISALVADIAAMAPRRSAQRRAAVG